MEERLPNHLGDHRKTVHNANSELRHCLWVFLVKRFELLKVDGRGRESWGNMSSKEDAACKDEEVVEKVESAEEAVDVVRVSHLASVASHCSRLAEPHDHEDEVKLEVEREAEDDNPRQS